jgi:rhodanese-related sulfurtransferase
MQPTDVHNGIDRLQLIDVREADEWRAGHITAAHHIPMDQLPDRLEEIDRERPIVTVCRSGSRSGKMAELLREHGYDADNMDGGMQAWDEAGLPYVPEDRDTPEVI